MKKEIADFSILKNEQAEVLSRLIASSHYFKKTEDRYVFASLVKAGFLKFLVMSGDVMKITDGKELLSGLPIVLPDGLEGWITTGEVADLSGKKVVSFICCDHCLVAQQSVGPFLDRLESRFSTGRAHDLTCGELLWSRVFDRKKAIAVFDCHREVEGQILDWDIHGKSERLYRMLGEHLGIESAEYLGTIPDEITFFRQGVVLDGQFAVIA